MVKVAYGEWLPDQGELDNPGALIARNVLPQIDHYAPLRSLSSLSDALATACLGSFWMQDASDTVFNFAGDAGNLYELANSTWNNVGSGYTVSNWEFLKFGQRVIAVGNGSVPQKYDVGTDVAFSALPNAPQAARGAVVRDFVVLGDLLNNPEVIQWSGLNNTEIWTTGDLVSQADSQTLFGRGGRVQRIVPGDTGIIFQEHSIRAMVYEGPPVVFSINEVERGRGTPAPNSVCWTGDTIFYLGHDGFYAFTGRSQPIGNNRVDNWFKSNSEAAALPEMRGAVDRQNRMVIWAFKSNSAAVTNDRLIIYNWGADRWSYAEVDTQHIGEYLTEGVTSDSLNVVSDTLNVLMDSDAYAGGRLSLAAFTPDNKLATFSGEKLDGEIDALETGELHRRTLQRVRPLVDGTQTQVCVAARARLGDPVGFTAPIDQDPEGECSVLINGRYHRIRTKLRGNWNKAQGVDIEFRNAGRR